MTCLACHRKTSRVMDFGKVALAGGFLKPDGFSTERRYPLTLEFCERCLLVQVGEPVSPEMMFRRYFYFSSATSTMRQHFDAYARELVESLHPRKVLEIGCNDGVLLRPLRALGVDVIGVDPATNVIPGDFPVVNAYWSAALAGEIGLKFDLILANNVLAHIPTIHDALEGVTASLAEDGRFVFEVNRLDSLISDLQYDWIYHEHCFYYSLLALDKLLERHGLEIYHLERLGTHAGSARYFAAKKGRYALSGAVRDQRERDMWMGLNRLETFRQFAARATTHALKLREALSGKRVAGYGACGRTNTLLQWCDLRPEYIVDDAPAKQGFYTPGTHVPIVPINRLHIDPPDVLVVFAWSFLAEIQPKLKDFRGDVLIPLPHIYRQERAAA